MKPSTFTPGAASAILATFLLARLAAAAPAAGAPSYTDPDYADPSYGTTPDWKEPQAWAPPAHFDWTALTYPSPPDTGYKRDAKAGNYYNGGGDNGGATPQVCSGNNNVASCCAGGACSVLPAPVVGGLLGLGGINALTNSGCQAQQQISCCTQNGGGLINVQSCGPLIDIL